MTWHLRSLGDSQWRGRQEWENLVLFEVSVFVKRRVPIPQPSLGRWACGLHPHPLHWPFLSSPFPLPFLSPNFPQILEYLGVELIMSISGALSCRRIDTRSHFSCPFLPMRLVGALLWLQATFLPLSGWMRFPVTFGMSCSYLLSAHLLDSSPFDPWHQKRSPHTCLADSQRHSEKINIQNYSAKSQLFHKKVSEVLFIFLYFSFVIKNHWQ